MMVDSQEAKNLQKNEDKLGENSKNVLYSQFIRMFTQMFDGYRWTLIVCLFKSLLNPFLLCSGLSQFFPLLSLLLPQKAEIQTYHRPDLVK